VHLARPDHTDMAGAYYMPFRIHPADRGTRREEKDLEGLVTVDLCGFSGGCFVWRSCGFAGGRFGQVFERDDDKSPRQDVVSSGRIAGIGLTHGTKGFARSATQAMPIYNMLFFNLLVDRMFCAVVDISSIGESSNPFVSGAGAPASGKDR